MEKGIENEGNVSSGVSKLNGSYNNKKMTMKTQR
jgi:hypothetical protein